MQPSWCGDTSLSCTAGGDVLARDAKSTAKEREEEASQSLSHQQLQINIWHRNIFGGIPERSQH